MNIALWVLQVLLALHTAMGAVWKFSHSPEQTMPSLKAIPNGVWLGMSGVELLCSVALVLPVLYKPLGLLAPAAAVFIALEMFVFGALHLSSGETTVGPLLYWGVVAALSAFIAYGRFALKPI